MARKLLLADDSLTIQKVVELVLVHENFDIKTANDGEQALEAVESFEPEIVLADIDMPKLNGYQLCEKIKNNAATVQVPVILLAGAFEPFDEEYARSVGADDYIIKPFESQELISKVKALLANADAAKEALANEALAEEIPEQDVSAPEMPAEEPKWDEEIPVAAGTQPVEQEFADEEYEAKAALSSKGFEDELVDALKEEKRPVSAGSLKELVGALEMPSKDDVIETLRLSIDERVSNIIDSETSADIYAVIKDSVERKISEIAPGIVENVIKKSANELLSGLKTEINAAISRVVPEIAEAIIKKEIEKITSEL